MNKPWEFAGEKFKLKAITICAQCQHFINKGPIWYSQFCGASALPIEVDPVTGRRGPTGTNDLGGKYQSDSKYHYARNINKGECLKFKEKGK